MTPPRHQRGQRGIALIITLLVVTLLSILVVEFTYSVQVESHISRNSLNALQAAYLARSGINILAGALMVDNSPNVDPDEEDKQDGWGAFAAQDCSPLPALELPRSWHLCVRIVDESGKININRTKPLVPLRANQTAPTDCRNGNEVCWLDALQRLLANQGLEDAEAVRNEIKEFWDTVQAHSTAGRAALPFDFGSVEDVSAAFPRLRTQAVFRTLRDFAAALPAHRFRQGVNINTAPPEVLNALIDDPGIVDNILATREEKAFDNVAQVFAQSGVASDPGRLQNMFTTKSMIFRLESSAVVNGIGKTIRALAQRDQSPPRPGAAPGTRGWRLTFLDWQKEGGADLFERRSAVLDDELELEDKSGNNL